MIISASRRTDIPSYYWEWLCNRIGEGYVLVRNPMNFHQVSRISLSPDDVDGMVLWTKNPAPMLERLNGLAKYPYYFQFTLTPYGADVEPNLPSKQNVIIPSFTHLSHKIGPERMIWRYDPILLSPTYTIQYHVQSFGMLAKVLRGFTKKCVISFLDMYRNTKANARELGIETIAEEDMVTIAKAFSQIAGKYGMELSTCSEAVDLSSYGVLHGRCIDAGLLEQLSGHKLKLAKDPNQRKECGCAASIDIGAYNSCQNMCKYCYANYSIHVNVVNKNYGLHNPKSPLLLGEVGGEDRIRERLQKH